MPGRVRSPLDPLTAPVPAPIASFVYVIGTLPPGGFKTYVGWTLDPDRRLEQKTRMSGARWCWQGRCNNGGGRYVLDYGH
jgi:hypothetical protein